MHHKWRSYYVWFLRYVAQQANFFVISGHFLLFYPLLTQKINFFKKWKNTWRYYHFTLVYHKCWSLKHCSWAMECDRQNLSLGPFFPLLPPHNPENQNFEKMKKTLGHIISVTYMTIICDVLHNLVSVTIWRLYDCLNACKCMLMLFSTSLLFLSIWMS